MERPSLQKFQWPAEMLGWTQLLFRPVHTKGSVKLKPYMEDVFDWMPPQGPAAGWGEGTAIKGCVWKAYKDTPLYKRWLESVLLTQMERGAIRWEPPSTDPQFSNYVFTRIRRFPRRYKVFRDLGMTRNFGANMV
jgi:hypothetical protein